MSFLDRREFVKAGLATSAAATFSLSRAQATGPNDEINLGFISCGGQAGGLMGSFSGVKGVHIGGLCDPDQGRLDSAGKRFPKAKKWQDLRHLLEDSSIDAVVIATCNHWHCLAAIWAMQAGKDVYVEKPLSHSQWEGRQTVAAARKYDRICQLGTQQRSDPMQTAIKKFLHQDKALGAIQGTRVNRYGVRGSIGKRSAALGINSEVDYNLWLGPAQRKPIFRNKLHYDWHWDWNTGSGEMGNWGVHVLDDVRNNVFQDQVLLPKRIVGGGGRVVWDDAGESPNVHFVQFDTGNIPVVIGLSNLTDGPGKRGSAPHPGPGSGYLVYCEGGRLEGKRGSAVAYDEAGKAIKKFKGNGGKGHQQNFIDAVRSRNRKALNSEVEVGHYSTGWCNLANVAAKIGTGFSMDAAREMNDDQGLWSSLLEESEKHLKTHGLAITDKSITMSPVLELDVATEQFVGEHAEKANRLLKRQYRKGFAVPKIG